VAPLFGLQGSMIFSPPDIFLVGSTKQYYIRIEDNEALLENGEIRAGCFAH
jgi:hypothetical protein